MLEPSAPPERYELAAVHALPQIHIVRSIKSALLSRRALQRFNALAASCNRALLALYMFSLPLDVAVLFVHESVGRSCAIVKLLCQLPTLLLGVSMLRVSMLHRLLWTYEFWFFSVMNVINLAATAMYYQDARALGAISHWLTVQMNICVDANMQEVGQLAGASLTAIVYQFSLLAAVSLQLTPATHTAQVLHYHHRAVTSNDVLVNTITTATILMIRTAYRKRQQHQRTQPGRTDSTSVVQCVSYRCRVKLQEAHAVHALVGASKPRGKRSKCWESAAVSPSRSSVSVLSASLQQLRLSSDGVEYTDSDTVLPHVARHLSGTSRGRALKLTALYAMGALGLFLNLVPTIWERYSFTHVYTLWVFSLLSPVSFFATFIMFYNRQLVRQLVCSFDFCYLSVNLTIVHLCVCDLFTWDTRCFAVTFNWLTMHWVITLDALTPSVRRRLGLRVRYVIPAIMFVMFALGNVATKQLALNPSRPVNDRVLWRVEVLGVSVEFRNLPFILNRFLTMMLWCIRILWRLCTSGDDDRIVIQGKVEFVASHAVLDRAVSATWSHRRSVQPFILSLQHRRSDAVHPIGVVAAGQPPDAGVRGKAH